MSGPNYDYKDVMNQYHERLRQSERVRLVQGLKAIQASTRDTMRERVGGWLAALSFRLEARYRSA